MVELAAPPSADRTVHAPRVTPYPEIARRSIQRSRVVTEKAVTESKPRGPKAKIIFGGHRETTWLPYHSEIPVPNPVSPPPQLEIFKASDLKYARFTSILRPPLRHSKR